MDDTKPTRRYIGHVLTKPGVRVVVTIGGNDGEYVVVKRDGKAELYVSERQSK